MKTALLTLLLVAIRKGDPVSVERFLAEDPALLNARTAEGVHAARLAMYHRHPDVARLFVNRGAALDLYDASACGVPSRVHEIIGANPGAVNTHSSDGATPLGLAAFFGHADIVRFLIEHKADPNQIATNPAFPFAPLHSAMSAGHRPIVDFLLEHGADVNVREGGGLTILHEAAGLGSREYVDLLLKHGALAAIKTDDGKTPADFAREYGHMDLAAYLTPKQ